MSYVPKFPVVICHCPRPMGEPHSKYWVDAKRDVLKLWCDDPSCDAVVYAIQFEAAVVLAGAKFLAE